jgi:hypothetical protein
MLTRTATAERSVLLDYTSCVQPVALLRSIRHSDLPVAATITNAFLLKVLIVVSTGLMTLNFVQVKRSNVQVFTTNSFIDDAHLLEDVGYEAYKSALGYEYAHSAYLQGNDTAFAFQSFNTLAEQGEYQLSGEVDSFSAGLDCEPASLKNLEFRFFRPIISDATQSIPGFFLYSPVNSSQVVSTDSCSAQIDVVKLPGSFVLNDPLTANFNATCQDLTALAGLSSRSFMFTQVNCSGSSADADQRILLAYSEILQEALAPVTYQNTSSSGANVTICMGVDVFLTFPRKTVFLCKPTYDMQKVQLTTRMYGSQISDYAISPAANSAHGTLSNVQPWALAAAQFRTFETPPGVKQVGGAIIPSPVNCIQNYATGELSPEENMCAPVQNEELPIQILLAFNQSPNSTIYSDIYFSAQRLQQLALGFWQPYMAILAREFLLTGPGTKMKADVTLSEFRLQVNNLPLRWMEALLAMMALLTIACMFNMSDQTAAPRRTSTLSGIMSVLKSSPKLAEFCAAWHPQWKDTGDKSSFWTFHSVIEQDRFIVETQNSNEGIDRGNAQLDQQRHLWTWWQPTLLRLICRVAACTILSAVVITLECLLRKSQTSHGLSIIYNQQNLHYAWTTAVAAVFVALGLYIGASDVNYRLLAPYYALSKKARYSQALSIDYLDALTPTTIVQGIRRRQWPVVLTALGAMISALLTIVASGLFTPLRFSVQSLQLNQSWMFNDSMQNYTSYYGDGMGIADLVLHYNLSMPRWTMLDMALGAVAPLAHQPFTATQNPDNPNQFSAVLPAIMSNLTCTDYSDVQAYCQAYYQLYSMNSSSRYALPLPLGYLDLDYSQDCEHQWSSALSAIGKNRYFGYFIPSDYRSSVSFYDGEVLNQPHFVWGKNDDASKVANVHFLMCDENILDLEVEVGFAMPDLDLDPSITPKPRWDTARKSTMPVLINRPDLLSNMSSAESLDWFFQALVHGKDAVPLDYLGDPSLDSQVTDGIRAMTSFYRAIEYSIDGRIAPNYVIEQASSRPAKLIGKSEVRLYQNAASTHVLAGLLLTILLLMGLAFFLMDTKNLVPINPSSIAAVGSFLAHSNIIHSDYLPIGAEWLSDEDMVKRGILQNELFGVELPAVLKFKRGSKNTYLPLSPQIEDKNDQFTIVAIEDEGEKGFKTSAHTSMTGDDSFADHPSRVHHGSQFQPIRQGLPQQNISPLHTPRASLDIGQATTYHDSDQFRLATVDPYRHAPWHARTDCSQPLLVPDDLRRYVRGGVQTAGHDHGMVRRKPVPMLRTP